MLDKRVKEKIDFAIMFEIGIWTITNRPDFRRKDVRDRYIDRIINSVVYHAYKDVSFEEREKIYIKNIESITKEEKKEIIRKIRDLMDFKLKQSKRR